MSDTRETALLCRIVAFPPRLESSGLPSSGDLRVEFLAQAQPQVDSGNLPAGFSTVSNLMRRVGWVKGRSLLPVG